MPSGVAMRPVPARQRMLAGELYLGRAIPNSLPATVGPGDSWRSSTGPRVDRPTTGAASSASCWREFGVGE